MAEDDKVRLDAFMNILEQGSKTNSYKFALARFLVNYDGPDTKVSFITIAEKFVEYYWFQTMASKLRQQAHAQGWLEATRALHKFFPEKHYSETFEEIKRDQPQAIRECARHIANECFHDVTWKFQRQKHGRKVSDVRLFFEYRIEKSLAPNKKLVHLDHGIVLTPGTIEFFQRYRSMLHPLVMSAWFRFIEKLNPGVPNIIEKLEGVIPQKVPPSLRKKVLEPHFKECFYCGGPMDAAKGPYLSHVLPREYTGEDEMWNMVLACKVCMAVKGSSLPPRKFLEKLFERNHEFRHKIPDLRKSVNWLGDEREDVERVITNHYDTAVAQGYPFVKYM